MRLLKILETTSNTLTGLAIFFRFFVGLTPATFNSTGKLDVNKALFNSSAKVSDNSLYFL